MVKRAEGCLNLHIAPHIIGEDGTITFGTPERLYGLETMSTTNGYAEATAYSDNQMDTNKRKPSYVDIAIVLRELSAEKDAKIGGHKYIKGKKVTSAKDSAPAWAVLYEQTNSDGTSTFRVYYNCTLQRDGTENTTVADSVTYDTVSITGKAIPLSNGDLDLTMESDAAGVTPTDVANFFKQVVLPPTEADPVSYKSREQMLKETHINLNEKELIEAEKLNNTVEEKEDNQEVKVEEKEAKPKAKTKNK